MCPFGIERHKHVFPLEMGVPNTSYWKRGCLTRHFTGNGCVGHVLQLEIGVSNTSLHLKWVSVLLLEMGVSNTGAGVYHD